MPNPAIYLLEEDLKTAWHFQREAIVRNNLKIIWSTVDTYLTVLDAVPVQPAQHNTIGMFNKPTAVYFEQSAQYGRYDNVSGYPCIQRIFIAAIYEAWRARCSRANMLDIEFGHFLANPVRITRQGPQNLGEIAAAHQSLCNMAERSGPGNEKYKILVSYPAVILIFDRKAEPRPEPGSEKDDDGLVNLRKVADQITVLVMRTGASLGSQKVTLDDLEPHALPLERSDTHGYDVRRVSLAIAVDLIINLEDSCRRGPQKSTYDSDLCKHEVPEGFDQSVRNDPRLWASALISSGAPCHFDLEHEEWSHHWKSGYSAVP